MRLTREWVEELEKRGQATEPKGTATLANWKDEEELSKKIKKKLLER